MNESFAPWLLLHVGSEEAFHDNVGEMPFRRAGGFFHQDSKGAFRQNVREMLFRQAGGFWLMRNWKCDNWRMLKP